MTRTMVATIAVVLLSACRESPTAPDNPAGAPLMVINEAGQLVGDYDLLVNTDRGRTEWLTLASDGLQAAYPSGQVWGFIGCVVRGNSTLGSRSGVDLGGYRSLQLQIKATSNVDVQVGLKDTTDPDTGVESRRSVSVTTSWQTVSFNLTDFSTADLSRIYMLFEVVFAGSNAQTVVLRDVRFVP
jgi:hypothetical protein